jgi:phage terminase large subunit GpA-like protein
MPSSTAKQKRAKSASTQSASKLLAEIVRPTDRKRMAEEAARALDLLPDHVTRMTVSEWAEQKRVLSADVTATPGPFRWNVTPYLKEIADCLSETSDVQEVVVMKGAQVGFTTGVLENWVGYIIDQTPGPSMMVDADKGMAEAGMEVRVDKMIESAGLQDKIFAQTKKKANKKSGDTKSRKDFLGGFFMAIGPKIGAKLRKFAIRFLSFDEEDAYPQQVGTDDGKTANEGDTVALAIRRTATFELVRKILHGSTPLLEATSRIAPLFALGDQCYYNVPCPHCGRMQRLRWRDPDGTFRLKFEQDEQGHLIHDSVHYECESCQGEIKNRDKWVILSLGKWIATATPKRPHLRSFHISSLYSIKQSWEEICQMWIETKDDRSKLRTFINTVLGEVWVEKGEAPRADLIFARRGGYEAGLLPPSAKPLFCTLGADIQKDRIECEVVAWGRDMESWSIEYLTLFAGPGPNDAPGETEDLSNKCWQELAKVIESPHSGLRIERAMIDAGFNTQTVYKFCDRYAVGVFPIKGDKNLTEERDQRIYVLRDNPPFGVQRADLDTGWLKLDFYQMVKYGTATGLPPTDPFPGYCHFPMDYGKDHFYKLTSEERLPRRLPSGKVVPKWEKHGRNEPLDCRAYAASAVYILYGERLRELRHQAEEDEKVDYSMAAFWKEWEEAHAGK